MRRRWGVPAHEPHQVAPPADRESRSEQDPALILRVCVERQGGTDERCCKPEQVTIHRLCDRRNSLLTFRCLRTVSSSPRREGTDNQIACFSEGPGTSGEQEMSGS